MFYLKRYWLWFNVIKLFIDIKIWIYIFVIFVDISFIFKGVNMKYICIIWILDKKLVIYWVYWIYGVRKCKFLFYFSIFLLLKYWDIVGDWKEWGSG